jgi:hypothetical protein
MKTKAITLNKIPSWVTNGATLQAYGAYGEKKGEYVVTSIKGDRVARVRSVCWYDTVAGFFKLVYRSLRIKMLLLRLWVEDLWGRIKSHQ